MSTDVKIAVKLILLSLACIILYALILSYLYEYTLEKGYMPGVYFRDVIKFPVISVMVVLTALIPSIFSYYLLRRKDPNYFIGLLFGFIVFLAQILFIFIVSGIVSCIFGDCL